jgi:hypothetical protein
VGKTKETRKYNPGWAVCEKPTEKKKATKQCMLPGSMIANILIPKDC